MENKKIAILLPCYNESTLLKKLFHHIEEQIKNLPFLFEVIFINDGSSDNTVEILKLLNTNASNINISLQNLEFNMGHQKAIFQGLVNINYHSFNHIIIMDSDGEDDPSAIPELLKKTDFDLVQVVRGKRKEKLIFRLFYTIYKQLFLFIIGKKLNFGNFSMIKPQLAKASVDNSFSHFAAFLNNQRCKKTQIIWDRQKRLDGTSKMNFTSLFYHAINSFVENSQNLLFLFIKLSFLILMGIFLLTGIVLYKKIISHEAIAGWSSSLIATLFNSLLICLGIFVTGSLQLNIISKRTQNSPSKNYTFLNIIKNW